jgi:hypothetical protein
MAKDRTPLSGVELSIVAKLGRASFPPATASKSFARNLCDGYVKELSSRGRRFLAFVAHRFRRQYSLSEEEKRWVAEWINHEEAPSPIVEEPKEPAPKVTQPDSQETLAFEGVA